MTELPALDEKALEAASFALARELKWERAPVSVNDIDALAARIKLAAEHHVAYLKWQKRDVNIVTRIIKYISHHHGGPWGGRVSYIEGMIDALVELACPNTQTVETSGAFYDDIDQGINQARVEAV